MDQPSKPDSAVIELLCICFACKIQEEPKGTVSGSPDQVHQGHVEHLSAIYQVSLLATFITSIIGDMSP